MFGYALVIKVVEIAVLAPLISLVLAFVVRRSGGGLVGNTDIVVWLLSPSGLLFALLAGSFLNLDFIFRAAGQYWIAESAHASLHTRDILIRVLRSFPVLFQFSVVAFLIAVVFLLPLAAGVGLVYLLFLQAHDINYYLATHPPEWYRALALAGTWALIWAIGTGLFLLRLVYALPAWLNGERPIRQVFRSSWIRTRNEWRTVAMTLISVVAVWLGTRFVLEGGLYLIMGTLVERMGTSVYGLLLAISVYLVLVWLLSTALSIAGLAWMVTVVARLFRGEPFPTDATPQTPALADQEDAESLAWTRFLRPTYSVPALALLLLAATVVSWIALSGRAELKRPLVIAHRAGAIHGPENSLSALELAIEQGADSAEIDVQRTRDGVVMVNHDADLMRVARDARIIANTDVQDLSDVDIGRVFGAAFVGEPLPTLEEFLERARDRIRLVIELKYYGGDPQLVPDVVKLVRKAGMAGQVDLMSLELSAVRQGKQEAQEMPSGYLATVTVGDLAKLDVDFLAVSQGQTSGALIRTAQGQGVPVYAWTVNDAEGMLDLMDLGIDGIITDDSALAVQSIEQVLTLSPAQRFILSFRDLWDIMEQAETSAGNHSPTD